MDVTWKTDTTILENPDRPYYELYTAARFITGLILYPIICMFGLTGNTLIIVILARKVALSSTDVLLSALAISDVKVSRLSMRWKQTFSILIYLLSGQSLSSYPRCKFLSSDTINPLLSFPSSVRINRLPSA